MVYRNTYSLLCRLGGGHVCGGGSRSGRSGGEGVATRGSWFNPGQQEFEVVVMVVVCTRRCQVLLVESGTRSTEVRIFAGEVAEGYKELSAHNLLVLNGIYRRKSSE